MKTAQRICTLLACSCVMLGRAQAQTWPTKPLKLIVPYAAAGAIDQLARAVPTRSAAPSASQWWWKTNPAATP